ncbi:MAG: hypothetical protein IID52_06840 [Proteobacteria bacterium]|nr:hypothetical protein [Pseudomonadota bacterium]
MKTFTNTDSVGVALDKVSLSAIEKRQAAIEAGLEEMERGLERLGLRIDLCRDRIVHRSPVKPGDLSLKQKFASRDRAMELAARTRRIGFDTRAIERETRNNCRKLNELSVQLKDAVARRRALDKKLPKRALKALSVAKAPDPRPSAKILRFSPIKTDE